MDIEMEARMRAAAFRTGDRVSSRITIGSIRVGTVGIILRAIPSVENTYDVAFDGMPVPCIMQAHMLSNLVVNRAMHSGHEGPGNLFD
jgi:hypothetical protein